MPFIRVPGLEGKVFVPMTDPGMRKKHPCKDCHFCQMCGDDRCALCKVQKESRAKKTVCATETNIGAERKKAGKCKCDKGHREI